MLDSRISAVSQFLFLEQRSAKQLLGRPHVIVSKYEGSIFIKYKHIIDNTLVIPNKKLLKLFNVRLRSLLKCRMLCFAIEGLQIFLSGQVGDEKHFKPQNL
jgi:hypothetical protein